MVAARSGAVAQNPDALIAVWLMDRVLTVTDSRQTASGSLEATGERLVPELQHGELVHAEHLARYRVAAQLARNRRVLDAASGEGYGTAILAAGEARSVVGVDVDPGAVEHARGRYGLDFEIGDAVELPFDDGAFDLVVSFETIEHVAEPDRALAEFRRVLSDEGTLIISTPNKHEYLVENEFHTREYTHEEFVAVLASLFPSVEILLQHNWLTSTVTSPDTASDAGGERVHHLDFYKLAGIRKGAELYTLALCGSTPGPAPRGVAVTAGIDEAHRHAIRLRAADETAERWRLQFLDAKQTAERWNREFQAMDRRAKDLGSAYDKAIAELEAAYRSSSWRITAPLRRVTEFLRARRG